MSWVLVTGGTGTVGGALVRRLLKQGASVRVLSRDETKLGEMHEQLKLEGFTEDRYRMFVGDVRDGDRLARAMDGVGEVYHAAALKHVDSCEYNPFETVKTNILGVQNLVERAPGCGVKVVVNMSSDKAAAPHNIMGASKLVGERLVSYANAYGRGCRFVSVRFGNVLGSRGSVLPLWQEQLRQGFVRVTDPAMTRYVMSVNMAVDLCLFASQGLGGEVFVRDMPAIRLGDLASVVVGAYELKHNLERGSIRQMIVGARPGETLDETVVTAEEAVRAVRIGGHCVILPGFRFSGTDYERVYGGKPKIDDEMNSASEKVLGLDAVRALLKEWGLW